MNAKNILNFLQELKQNNNREWFAENKDWYLQCKTEFEAISDALITEIAKFDAEIKTVESKDCIFRIYKDTRFSHDKTPYKTHFGTYIATRGGRKSPRGGYYLHIDADQSFLAAGVWCPEPNVLKALRQAVYENIDEFLGIIDEKQFKSRYTFAEDGKLKTLPRGYPKEFPQAELLKLKHYCVECPIEQSFLMKDDFIAKSVEILKISYPLNRFLNYTVDEVLDL